MNNVQAKLLDKYETTTPMYVGYDLDGDRIWVTAHHPDGSATLHFTPQRAMDLADAIYDYVNLRSMDRSDTADE